MGAVKRFEELHVWQAARELVKQIYEVSKVKGLDRDFGLRDQIRRAAGSVMHNIAEGFDAGSDGYFLQFLGYARRSASEVQSQLYAALDQEYISKKQFDEAYGQTTKVKQQLNGLIGYLAQSKSKTIKEEYALYGIDLEQISLDLPDDYLDGFDQSDD